MSLTSHESKSSLESAVHESKSSPKSLFMRLEFPSLVCESERVRVSVCPKGFHEGFLRMHLIVSHERFMRAAACMKRLNCFRMHVMMLTVH